MKRLLVFLATLLAIASTAWALPFPCEDTAGSWTSGSGGVYEYVCTQPTGKHFTCTVAIKVSTNPDTYCHMLYTGDWDNTNSDFSYSATYSSGTCNNPSHWSGTLQVGGACQLLRDSQFPPAFGWPTAYRGTFTNGNINFVCEVPDRENGGAFVGWGGILNTYAEFVATLHDPNDSNFNFSGRETKEIVTLLPGGCPYNGGLSQGGTWDADPTYSDSVGYSDYENTGSPPTYAPDAVGFQDYNTAMLPGTNVIMGIQRNYAQTLPCSITATQYMYIDCQDTNGDGGTNWQLYETHNNVVTIGDGTLEVKRGTADSGVENWGLTRKDWSWLDLFPVPVFFYPFY